MTRQQTIIRAPRGKDCPYFAVRRGTAQDSRLSFEARGALIYFLSKPDDWEIQLQDIMREGHCGRDRALRILKELETCGYLTKEKQTQNKEGRFNPVSLLVHEVPCTEKPDTVTGTPSTEKPLTGEPLTENPTHTYKRDRQRTDQQNKDSAPDGAGAGNPPPDRSRPLQPYIALIDAYLDALETAHRKPIEADPYKRRVRIASAMHLAGITPDQVRAFVQAVYTPDTPDSWWRDRTKPIPLETVAEQLPAWLAKQKPPDSGKNTIDPLFNPVFATMTAEEIAAYNLRESVRAVEEALTHGRTS